MKQTVHQFGDRAVLVDLAADQEVAAVVAALANRLSGCSVRGGMNSVLVEAELPQEGLLARVTTEIESLTILTSAPTLESRVHHIKVNYDGADLHRVAELMRGSREEVIALHSQTVWRVALIGFAPGFPYLVPSDGAAFAELPRLSEPRPQVPAGAVAVAAGMSCIYPSAMPGGWNLIGTTDAVLFNPNVDQPSLMQQGDLVRFEAI